MPTVMPKLPRNYEELIGKPQVIARMVELDGRQVLVRLQKPFEEPEYDNTIVVSLKIKAGKPVIEPIPKNKRKDESHIVHGTALVIESWSDATKSIVTTGIQKAGNTTDEAFAFGVRYMLNHASDAEIIAVLREKKLDIQLKFQCNELDSSILISSPPKLEKKKPT